MQTIFFVTKKLHEDLDIIKMGEKMGEYLLKKP